MSACTFFGHREYYSLDEQALMDAIEDLICKGVDTFYVGNQGQFDSAVYSCLKQLRKEHPHIRVCIVLAYLPTGKNEYDDMADTMYPEIEGHPKFAIERRNRWMLDHADIVVTYITHSWGGAAQFAELAERMGKQIVGLGF